MKRRKRKVDIKFVDGSPLHPTSSLNDYSMCICNRKFTHKLSLIKHIKNCKALDTELVCRWCNVKFRNRGNLVNHAYYMHGEKDLKKDKPVEDKLKHICDACEKSFEEPWKLKYHIRRYHFNLWARIPHAETKRVNQIWFEKVLNTNVVVQIKKTGLNKLVIKPLPPNTDIEIQGNNKRLDLRSQYPFGRRMNDELCKICLKIYRKSDLQKHMNEMHFNVTKHKCNNCNQTFKRSYVYLQHVCHKAKYKGKKRKVNGVKQVAKSSIRITGVESLKAVVVD